MVRISFVLVGVVLGLSIVFQAVTQLYGNTLEDFGSFLASGQAIQEGANPYDEQRPLVNSGTFQGQPISGVNLNPPIVAIAFAPLAAFDPWTLRNLWLVLSFLAYILAAALIARMSPVPLTQRRILWCLAIAPLWYTLGLGQLYLVLLALAVGGWFCLHTHRPMLAGVLIGILAAVKPNFLVWPALLFLGGETVAGIVGFLTAGALSLLPAVIVGPRIYQQWLGVQNAVTTGRVDWPGNASIIGLAARLHVAPLGYLAAACLLLGAAWWAWMTKPSTARLSEVGLLLGVLCSPLAWLGYLVFLLPLVLRRPWRGPLLVAVVLLCIPWSLIAGTGVQSAIDWYGVGAVNNIVALLVLITQPTITAKERALLAEAGNAIVPRRSVERLSANASGST